MTSKSSIIVNSFCAVCWTLASMFNILAHSSLIIIALNILCAICYIILTAFGIRGR